MDPSKLTDCLLHLSYQRTLPDFELALKEVMAIFDLNAWACLFPPSFNAGGNNMIIAKGIPERNSLPNQQSLSQLTQIGFNRQTGNLLKTLRALEFNVITSSDIITKHTKFELRTFLTFHYRHGTSK